MTTPAHPPDPSQNPKTCLVTTGATSVFESLLSESLSAPFLSSLASHGYTTLILQCGSSKAEIDSLLKSLTAPPALAIETHALLPSLTPLIRRCLSPPGLVISHAGSGTIIDVLAEGARMIAVPNQSLKDNHQAETADEFARRGLVVRGEVGKLVEALEYSEKTPKLKTADDDEEGPSLNLMDVVGALALSAANPSEFQKQVASPSFYRSS